MENNLNKNEFHYHSSGGSFWDNFTKWFRSSQKKQPLTKDSVRILFIDDNKFPIIENLRNAGYIVEWIKDIKSIENSKVKDAHVLFVDYKGVGKNLSQNKEGFGVCKKLKDTYKETKYIVLCTGESIPNELLKEIRSVSDDIITKSLETTDFINVIDTAINKIIL